MATLIVVRRGDTLSSIIDRTDTDFVSTNSGAGSLPSLSGDVLEFWETFACGDAGEPGSCRDFQTGAVAAIRLRVIRPERSPWEKEYRAGGTWMPYQPDGGRVPYEPPTHHLAELFMQFIRTAVNSAELLQGLGGSE